MRRFKLHSEILISRSLDELFPFFSDAGNLDLLTPHWLHFRIVTPQPITIRLGAEIDYRLRFHGLALNWKSRITVWDPPNLFVDEQVRGPYRRWVHEHRFRAVEAGTVVEDQVEYAVWGGSIVNRFFVAPDLGRIFEFRRAQLAERFPPRVKQECG